MNKPKVHNIHHNSAPDDAIFIGRGSPWGNPYVIGRDGWRDEVCDKFEKKRLPYLDLTKLVGHDLVCYCKPARCHGDAILERIERIQEARGECLAYNRMGGLDEVVMTDIAFDYDITYAELQRAWDHWH